MTTSPPDPRPDQEPKPGLEANAELRAVVAAQGKHIAAQGKRIAALESELADLRGRLGQDSKSSSAPPSRDSTNRRERRAAEAAERKAARTRQSGGEQRRPGKQPGAPGSTLMRRTPDRTRHPCPRHLWVLW